MNLNEKQAQQVIYICRWLSDYDEDLPNRDGDRTETVLSFAQQLIRLMYKEES